MTDMMIGLSGVGILLLLMALRVPIAVSLGVVSLGGIVALRGVDPALGMLRAMPYEFGASWTLSAVPMFLLMGAFAYHSGLTRLLYDAARLWLMRVPGGLALATNFGSAGFAAVSGSSMATTASMGRLAIPEMLRYGYDRGLATGTVAASGTLGALIPPSILFIIYGWYTEQSISKLFLAGVIPGLLTAVFFASMIVIRCWLNPKLAPQRHEQVSWAERMASLRAVWPLPLLVLGVLGSIYGGVASPTEAGALGAAMTLAIALLQRRLPWRAFCASLAEALRTTASIFFIAIGAVMLTRFLAMAGLSTGLVELVTSMDMTVAWALLALVLVYLVLGMFLDPLGVMLLTLPVFLPVFHALNMDLIWIGVLVVKLIEVGLLTPPVGMNVYVVKSVVGDQVALGTVFKGLLWFLLCEALLLLLLGSFPQLALWLPNLVG
ncbi:TRAP transporter large permease [Alloalcanivorax xenomutans]|uniref:TRAP transporter large permease protein n=2 Tax=Alcanivoracaceae TaxID=224372 RepID=A0A9Q3VYT1_9GAMM|nr:MULTISPECIES: TRAP transporter large permease [Alcanivoracaceae]KAF0808582.1 TrapT family protein [Alcanivorax xiamenensis]MCE7507560.1 TRAP transporter large permease [Alloalcanivorax xenomutans]